MTRLYLITPPVFDLPAFRDVFAAVCDAADIPCVQLRLKQADDATWQRSIETLMPLAHARNIAFILNDRADLAKKYGCDGVHLGKDDAPYAATRHLLGPDSILGVSCYGSKDLAMDLAAAGADYVAFGAVFPSTTKPHAPAINPQILEDWVTFATTPCVAIGGIHASNCRPLVQMGVDFIAVIGAVWDHPDGAAAGARALQQAMAAG